MKHTQGNWTYHNGNASDYYDIDCDGNRVASIYIDPSIDTPKEEHEANAKLIAAAPELLTATHNALQSLLAVNELNNGLIPDSRLKELQTAINKATL